jgi:hypothetical protein
VVSSAARSIFDLILEEEVEVCAVSEIALVPKPADDECWVYRVGAERPSRLARSEAIERQRTLERME